MVQDLSLDLAYELTGRSNSKFDFVLSFCLIPTPVPTTLLPTPALFLPFLPLESMPCSGGQDTPGGKLICSLLPTCGPILLSLAPSGQGAWNSRPSSAAGSMSFSAGKFFLLSNFSLCYCPTALISSLLFLGNLGVDLLYPQGTVLGDEDLGGGGLGLSPFAQSQWGRRASALGGHLYCAHRLACLVWVSLAHSELHAARHLISGLARGLVVLCLPGSGEQTGTRWVNSAVRWAEDGHRAVQGTIWG